MKRAVANFKRQGGWNATGKKLQGAWAVVSIEDGGMMHMSSALYPTRKALLESYPGASNYPTVDEHGRSI